MNWQSLFKKQEAIAANNNDAVKIRGKSELFRFFTPMQSTRQIKRRITAGTVLAITVAVSLLSFVGQHSSPDFLILTGVLLAMCGLIFYDMSSRKFWVNTISDQFQKMTKQHDRVVREVATNRHDISILKDGLADTAQAVALQGKRMEPSDSAEAKMIQTMAGHLGKVGSKPSRASARPVRYNEILELQMAPPTHKEPPKSESEEALASDYSKYTDTVVMEILDDAIRHNKIDLFMQPIVGLPSRQTKMYELYGRVRVAGGSYLPAHRFLEVAEDKQVISTIDNLLLLRCLELLQEKLPFQGTPPSTPYVLNISGTTLKDRGFMGDLVTFLSRNAHMAKRLTFEIPQLGLENIDNKSVAILKALSKLGCRFSMDRIYSRHIDIEMLKAMHIRSMKMDSQWLITEASTDSGLSRIMRIKTVLDSAGIDIVVDRIETEDDLLEVLDFGVDYGQGYLFGKPDMAPAYITPYMPGNTRPKRSSML